MNIPVPVQVPVQLPVQVPVQVPVQMPVIPHVAKASTPYEINKLFNEMKNSKKPFMTITMKAPTKTSMFPDPFSLFDDDSNRYFSLSKQQEQKAHTAHNADQDRALDINAH